MSASYSLKWRVIRLLQGGAWTAAEIAGVSGVPRRTVYRWASEAEIDWQGIRKARLVHAWERSALVRSGARPSKKRLRQAADEAKVAWDMNHEA